jgi:putative Mn2+ efflux pump MntP
MSILELFLVAVSLSMDAFAVSICKGLALKKIRLKDSVVVGLWSAAFRPLCLL